MQARTRGELMKLANWFNISQFFKITDSSLFRYMDQVLKKGGGHKGSFQLIHFFFLHRSVASSRLKFLFPYKWKNPSAGKNPSDKTVLHFLLFFRAVLLPTSKHCQTGEVSRATNATQASYFVVIKALL